MLTLTRRLNEEIVIGDGADEIRLVIKRVRGGAVRIGIAAPIALRVRRGELPKKELEAIEIAVQPKESRG